MNYLGTGDEPGFDSAPCALCSEPITTYIGVFEPTRTFAKRIGEPKGKHRTVLYRLCDSCVKRTDIPEAIESGILRAFALGRLGFLKELW